jgi:hypothetical protein
MENLTSLKIENEEEQLEQEEYLPQQKLIDKEVSNKIFKNSLDDGTYFDYNSEEDQNPLVNFDNELHYIKELKAVDIVFVVDCTASMKPMFKGVKKFIRKLVWDANKCITQYLVDDPEPLMVGLVQYRDHPPQSKTFLTQVSDLTSNFSKFKSVVMKMTAEGGGDGPEGVLDALQAAVSEINWRSESFKFIYHFLDSPPHGKEFNDLKDGFPDGCPCNIEYDCLFAEMRGLSIEYNVIKLSDDLEKMISVFSKVYSFDVLSPQIEMDASKKVEQTP